MELTFRPIGFVSSPFIDKAAAPRQATVGEGTVGVIRILPEFEDGLADLEGFERIWILFAFHQVESARLKVLPPRSDRKRGVFATRSPHRPNPIGMSAVRLESVRGLEITVRDLDMVDGTPVLDVKPYIAYADAFPDATQGWLETPPDPIERWAVSFSDLALEQLRFLVDHGKLDLRSRIEEALALGPRPHAYRRIRTLDDGAISLAVKAWRIRAVVAGRTLVVENLSSGYRGRDLAEGTSPEHALARAFIERFT